MPGSIPPTVLCTKKGMLGEHGNSQTFSKGPQSVVYGVPERKVGVGLGWGKRLGWV